MISISKVIIVQAGPSMMWFFYASCWGSMRRFLKFPAWLGQKDISRSIDIFFTCQIMHTCYPWAACVPFLYHFWPIQQCFFRFSPSQCRHAAPTDYIISSFHGFHLTSAYMLPLFIVTANKQMKTPELSVQFQIQLERE